MKKVKQILAILGIVVLVGMYGITLFCAIFDNSDTMNYLKAAIVATVIVPTLLWIYAFIYKLLKKDDK
ncbi:MAG: hypothetical protein IKJ01_03465 [Lachnospiraceae bacterium]|nr:hypothetical protein [Lachnospiraceae bacterium]